MSICLCYHDEQNFLHERGVCYGTKEKEPCSCGGNPVKCDFYEEVREKYIHRTNADRIRAMSDEELAQWICSHITECSRCEGRRHAGYECEFRNGRSTGLTMWLKSPVEEVDNG